MARHILGTATSTLDVGTLAFGRAPGELAKVVTRLLDELEEVGHSAEEHDVEIRMRHEQDRPLLQVEVQVLAGECGDWQDVVVGPGAGRPYRVWCDLEVFHEGDHRAQRGHLLHTWPRAKGVHQ